MRGDRIFGKISVRESKGVLILTLIIVALQGAALLYGEWERSRRPSGVESDMSQSIATSSHLPKKESPKTKYESRRENLSQRRVVVELNSSDSATLLSVPGIGPYFASAILKLREELGGFVSHRQLLEIRGIDSTKLG
ncbi:MAG: helix-hairpin-helix domain-containing protein, partial [Bacteroidales bacterium]